MDQHLHRSAMHAEENKTAHESTLPEVTQFLAELAGIVQVAQNGVFAQEVARAADVVVAALRAGNKILTCGNGGSASDAAHLAEELLGRYKQTRRPLAAICLSSDGPALTCIGNDFGFDQVFARQVEALGTAGDVLVAFTTSGKSDNVNAALRVGRERKLINIAVTGANAGESGELAHYIVKVPSTDSARVQELHTFVLHSICAACEKLDS